MPCLFAYKSENIVGKNNDSILAEDRTCRDDIGRSKRDNTHARALISLFHRIFLLIQRNP